MKNLNVLAALLVLIFNTSLSQENDIVDSQNATVPMEVEPGHSPFYWQPKMLITLIAITPTYNVAMVVLLRGYKLGITTMALVEGLPERRLHPQFDVLKAPFYSNAYRWFRRYISLLPLWVYGEGGHFYETLKLWKSRFMYADVFVPRWIQKLLIYIPEEDWDRERKAFALFTKYAGDTFQRQMRFHDGTKEKPLPHWLESHESDESRYLYTSTTPPTTTEVQSTTFGDYVEATPAFKNFTAFIEKEDPNAPWFWTWEFEKPNATTEKIWYYSDAPWSWSWYKPNYTSPPKGDWPLGKDQTTVQPTESGPS